MSRVWSAARNDSSRFKRPEGHTNPEMRYRGTSYSSRDATLGAFRPGANVIDRLPASDSRAARPVAGQDPGGAASKGRCTSPTAASISETAHRRPRIGDLRVSYQLAPGGPASIVARQAGTGFAEYQTKAGDRLLLVRPGTQSAADMFAAAQRENRILTWLLRLAGVFAMFLGFILILNPLVVVADVVPFIGSILRRERASSR